jgi:adenylate cyclase
MEWYSDNPTQPTRGAPRLGEALPGDEIHSQLARIVRSSQFRDSLRLTRFLTFTVETTLAGKADSLKAYTIAIEALGRGENFDPQRDPIVRVEAGRLRRALANYYAAAGRDDPLLIGLPRGTYVPTFQRQPIPPPQQTVSKDPWLVSASDAFSARPPALSRTLQLANNTIGSVQLLQANHRNQFNGFLVELDSVRETLRQSRDLLKSNIQLDFFERPAPPQMLNVRDRADTADAPDAGPHEGPLTDSLAGEPPPKSQPGPAALPARPTNSRATPASRRMPTRIVKIAFAAIAVLAILEVLFDIDRPLVGGPNHGLLFSWTASQAPASRPQDGAGTPILYVEPVTAIGEPPSGTLSPTMIHDRMIDALARFDDVTVVAESQQTAPAATDRSRSNPASPSYRLSATVHYYREGSVELVVQLIDMADNALAWSKTYEHPSKPDLNHKSGRVVGDIARSLLDPFGVIQARERIKRAAADPMQDTYRCILDANAYLRSFNPAQHQPVQDCLMHASTREPADVTVFADLAFVYLRNYRFGISSPPGDRTMLDNAYAMATRAADIKPNSALAQYVLQQVLLAKGDIARAKIADDNAFRLNPNDRAVVFGHATFLILTGDVDAGLGLLKQNTSTTPNSWIGYHLLMALGYYLKGDFQKAATESAQIASPFFPPGLVLDALVADKTGDLARAQQDIAMLSQFYPAWRANVRANVARFLPDADMANRVTDDFEGAIASVED